MAEIVTTAPDAERFGTAVRMETHGSVAVILIDNPPVNASSAAVRGGLREAVAAVAGRETIEAAVLIGTGRTFVAGSDMREFGQDLPPPELPEVIAAIEACPKPVVAAIHGVALGGGYELALGCDWRIADGAAVVGLPEAQLGMIPGAGGTQRLPRLAGIAKAIEIVTSGRRVPAREAKEIGMVDALATGDLKAAAIGFAREKSGKRRVAEMSVPAGEGIEEAEAAALRKGRGRECVVEAVAAVRMAETVPIAEALRRERETFQRLRVGEEANALRYGFFAERAAGKIEGLEGVAPLPLGRVGVVGAGTMGVGIAAVAAAAGHAVVLFDADAGILEQAPGRIGTILSDLERVGKLKGATAAGRAGAVRYAGGLAALGDADFVIEAVFEDRAVKSEVLRDLGAVLKPEAVLATNTSYLDLDDLAGASGIAERFLGLHFFAPVPRMRLVEIVEGARTGPEALATGFALAKSLGKLAVLARPCEGFIGNRIYARYRAQCEFALEEGALPHEIDAAVTALGFAMGPFAVADLSGLDIAWRFRRSKAATRDPRQRYVSIPDSVCELGRLGRKTGAGWYDYDADGKPQPSPVVAELVAGAAALLGVEKPDAQEIGARVLGAIANEAALIVAEGIARSAAEIDLVLVNGYGFSRFKGGPLFQLARRDPGEVEAMVEAAARAMGEGFLRGNVGALLAPLR